MAHPKAYKETELFCDVHQEEHLLTDGYEGFLCSVCDQAYIDSFNDYPTEEFYDYYDRSSKKSDLIEIIWHLMTQKQRAEILKDLLAEEDSDEEVEDDVDPNQSIYIIEKRQ